MLSLSTCIRFRVRGSLGQRSGHKFGSGSEDVMLQPLEILEEGVEGSRGFKKVPGEH